MFRCRLSALSALVGLSLAASFPLYSAPVDFGRDIRPLLSDRCFRCHGPDEESRKAGLRLDTQDGSRMELENGGQIIHPGSPEQSELIRRIFSSDPDEQMPPPESNLSLDDSEKSLIRQWIAQGADYEQHWSFLPVRTDRPVEVGPEAGGRIVDDFIADRLKDQAPSLSPSPPADRETMIRRLSLDLTGLPPTVEQVESFMSNESPDAYEQLVDTLLASPHYGEQRAVEWMDLARYADTYGYQADVDRDMSPWRDWVIRAFNENLPYDEFIRWQIAGDLLPDATAEQKLATAFNRLHRQTNEGGSIEEEFRVEYVSDRVHTFGTAFLGMTFECARCHDHKYDPVSQRDYYSLTAFFNNIDESGLYSHFTRATPTPTLLLYESDEQKQRHHSLKQQIRELEQETQRLELANQEMAKSPVEAPIPVAAFSFDEQTDNRSPDRFSTNQAFFVDGPRLVPGRFEQAVQFSGDNEVHLNGTGHFTRVDPFSISLWMKRTEYQERAMVLHHSRAWTDSGSRGYELVLQHGRPFFGLIHFWPGNAVAILGNDPIPMDEWVQVTLTHDGSSRAEGLDIYINGHPVETEIVRDNLYKDIVHRKEWGDSDIGNIKLTLGGRFRDSGFINGSIDEVRVYHACLTPEQVRADHERMDVVQLARDRNDSSTADPSTQPTQLSGLRKQLAVLRREENELVNDIPEIMVMEEMEEQRPTFVLKRGAYDARGAEVQPDVPSAIHPWKESWPRNRLGLARWLTDPSHPLTARVTVNRAWKQHFGRGLVETVEDFGSQGRLPTHPKLLDWLAAWFVENDWDLKALHKLIVMSDPYRQRSVTSDAQQSNDPFNHWIARGPRHRLSAEIIRDQALAASGLMNETIGGPSVKPYQPSGLWEESGTGKSYQQDQGDKLYRRSLYTFWRRTAPPPSMLLFDATSREVCTARREVTSTPLQSLVLMNDPQFLEASRVLAEELTAQHGKAMERIETGFERILSRSPGVRELEILHKQYQRQLELYSADLDSAAQILQIGEHPGNSELPPDEVAALTLVLNTLMNFDGFVMKR